MTTGLGVRNTTWPMVDFFFFFFFCQKIHYSFYYLMIKKKCIKCKNQRQKKSFDKLLINELNPFTKPIFCKILSSPCWPKRHLSNFFTWTCGVTRNLDIRGGCWICNIPPPPSSGGTKRWFWKQNKVRLHTTDTQNLRLSWLNCT